jgi:Tetratricopeptide repeat
VIAHRLVLRVVRDRLTRRRRLAAVCRDAAAVVDARAEALAGSQDRVAVRDIPEQVMALWDHAASSASGAGEELVGMLLGLRLWALYHLNALGDSAAQAILAGEPLVADFERVLGPDHPNTMGSRNNLAAAYRAAGRAAEAIPLHEQTLAAYERVLGPDHPDTLSSRNNLAGAYWAAGRAAEAIPLFEQTLAAFERMLGPDHPDALRSRNNLAYTYVEAGRTAEAIPLHEQTLAAREPPPTSPSTTTRAAWPFCWTLCGRRAGRTRPPRCWSVILPPASPSTTPAAWPGCWTACRGQARRTRPPRCWWLYPHEAEDGTSTPMLLARSRHASVRSLERYARPGPEAVGRHVAATDPAARRRRP